MAMMSPNGTNSRRSLYRAELDENKAAVDELRKKCRAETVTFVYAASDEEHNSAVLLKDYVEGRAR